MTTWAIVPVKPLRLGKSRLADVLTDDERARLNRMFLERTLSVVRDVKDIGQTLVVSRDPAALAIAREYGARTVLEDGSQQLNLALKRATTFAMAYAVNAVLIVPADLPLVTVDDIHQFVVTGKKTPFVTIAPDRREDGTNAMMICPPRLIDYNYGIGSFKRHSELARQAGANLNIVRSANLSLDLDLPEDLEVFKQRTEPIPQIQEKL
jgi:2-phospho-L-lactate/phosphoenolpyruvate guanylyltransferase